MSWRVALALVGGCNYAFGIPTSNRPADATVSGDVAPVLDAGPCGTHDEDGDGMPDRCDACPMAFDDAPELDGDGDGVVCDPAPTVTGDRLVLFDGFDQRSTEWVAVGTWTFGGDQVAFSDTFLGSLHRPIPQPSAGATAMTQITFTTTDTKSAAGVDLVLAVHTFSCLVYRDTVDELRLYEVNVAAPLQTQVLGGAGPIQLRVGHRASGEVTCTGARLGAAPVDASDTGKFVEDVSGAGLASGGIAIRADYLAVYTSP